MLVIGGIVILWYLSVVIWATRPLHEVLMVGTDYTATTPQQVVVEVECASPFSNAGVTGDLPQLTPQPADRQPLGFPREPCRFVHSDARMVLLLDTAVLALVLGILAYLWRRAAKAPAHELSRPTEARVR
jgi:hypothetical protein